MAGNVIPTLPENAPFTGEQRAWLNGFLAGLFYDRTGTPAATAATDPQPQPSATPLLIAFGSQTGAAERLAKQLGREAGKRGFVPAVKELNAVTPDELAGASRCVVISSTWGDGDPPDNATGFWNWLNAENAPRLGNLAFGVLGLGDRNYADFCGASKKFDQRLGQLGASRLIERGECDVDYEATANAWIDALWPALLAVKSVIRESAASNGASIGSSRATEAGSPITEAPITASLTYSRTHPFPARLKTNRKLNREGSAKDTRHFEITLEGQGLEYEVGDALGVVPANCPVLLEELLAALNFEGEESVQDAEGRTRTLWEALLRDYVITAPTGFFLREAATRSGNADVLGLFALDRKDELDAWLRGRDLVDVLRACPAARFEPAEFTGLLRKLQPRLYSISSSPKRHPGEVHLTVAAVRYEAHGRPKRGVASCWLADRVICGETPVPVFIQKSHGFRLPKNGDTPVIMIGPGTGIAPFRAFLEEREAVGATGRNWLVFGDQQRTFDFPYEEQLTAWHKDGHLARLDLAFSRDQAEKIYVQDRMREQSQELYGWLEAGAHLYVCGDARRMAKDVDAALHKLIESAGQRTPEQAAEYVSALKSAGRYQRDVY